MKVLGHYIMVFFVFLSAAACGKIEQKVEYYKDGTKKQVAEIKEGKPHGKTIVFFRNGKKEFQQEYKQGKKNGKRTEWYENGQVSGESYGKKQSVFTVLSRLYNYCWTPENRGGVWMRALIIFMLACSAVVFISGCDEPRKPIGPGTSKYDVIEQYGRPDGWYIITKEQEIQVVSYWMGSGPKKDMPYGEIWVLEYKTKHGGKPACIWIKEEVVDKIEEGPFLK